MSELTTLENLLSLGKISRREFIARVSALGLMAAVSPMLLATPARAAQPKRGGRLRAGLSGGATTDSLDPATITDIVPGFICASIYNYLVEMDYDSNPIPALAESWEALPGASQWTFKLRRGVEFHNGKELTAEDVIFSINHHRGEKSKSGAKPIVKSIKELKADGKYTVIFTLAGGNADFPVMLTDSRLAIVPAGTTNWELGIGSGPFMRVKHEPGVRALLKRNPNYWKKGRPYFDEVEVICISDVSARITALKTGKIDLMNRVDLKMAHLLKRAPGIQLFNVTSRYHYAMPMLCDVPPFDNNDVRLGLKYAVDREQMLKNILRGYGTIGNDQPISSAYRYFNAGLPQRHYDPDKAKFHIKKAGYLDHTFTIHPADAAYPGAVDTALLYKEQAAKAGIKIKVVREPNDGYWSNVWMKKPWCFCYWTGRPTEDWMFATEYAADSPWNDTHWKNKRFNELLGAARSELDDAKRRQMYGEMQRLVRDDGGNIIPLFPNIVDAGSAKLGYKKIANNSELDGGRAAERMWFKS